MSFQCLWPPATPRYDDLHRVDQSTIQLLLDCRDIGRHHGNAEPDMAMCGPNQACSDLQSSPYAQTKLPLQIAHDRDDGERAKRDLPSHALNRPVDTWDIVLREQVIEPFAFDAKSKRCNGNIIDSHGFNNLEKYL
jgi:hypothetical protein